MSGPAVLPVEPVEPVNENDPLALGEDLTGVTARVRRVDRRSLTLVTSDLSRSPKPRASSKGRQQTGLKRHKSAPGRALNDPPTPWGCEWRRDQEGWALWRCWSEREALSAEKIRKSRYAGHLSGAAWEVMKEYDYEAFLATIGQRFRRHGKR